MSAIRPQQIKAIHAIKTRTRLDEGSYRAMLAGFGVATSKDLAADDADRFLARLRDIPGASNPVQRPAKDTATGPYAEKLQALWIALYNLAEVRNRTDAAMHRFLERQTGVPHTRFLREARSAERAIEALKAWLRRAGVVIPQRTGDPLKDKLADKREILRAQWRRGLALGVLRAVDGLDLETYGLLPYASQILRGQPRGLGALDCPSLTPEDLNRVAAALGAKLRKAKTGEARRAG